MSQDPFHYDGALSGPRPATAEEMFRALDGLLATGLNLDSHEVRVAVYRQFFDARVPDPDTVPPDEVHFWLGPGAATSPQRLEIATRAVTCGARVYLVTPYDLKRQVFPDSYEDVLKELYTLAMPREFVELVMELRPLVADGCVQVMPMSAVFTNERNRSHTHADHRGLLRVYLDDEFDEEGAEPHSALLLTLPRLVAGTGRNVLDPRYVLDLRSEYADQFRAFQRGLRSMLPMPLGDERRLHDAIMEVDENVRLLDESMRSTVRKHRLAMLKLAIVPFPFLLTMVVPHEIVDVAAMLGGTSVLDYVLDVRSFRRESNAIMQDAFYAPWLLAPGVRAAKSASA